MSKTVTMSDKLQQIKDEYAREKNWDSYELMIGIFISMDGIIKGDELISEATNEIARRYATACCKADREGIVAEIEKVADQYPYKKSGDRESYSERREAMSDAFDLAQQAVTNSSIVIL